MPARNCSRSWCSSSCVATCCTNGYAAGSSCAQHATTVARNAVRFASRATRRAFAGSLLALNECCALIKARRPEPCAAGDPLRLFFCHDDGIRHCVRGVHAAHEQSVSLVLANARGYSGHLSIKEVRRGVPSHIEVSVKRGGFSDLDAAKNLLTSKLKMEGQLGY
jgi:hypothetical protein